MQPRLCVLTQMLASTPGRWSLLAQRQVIKLQSLGRILKHA